MTIIIFLFIIIAIIIIVYSSCQENFTNTQTSNEALQNISSVFNNQNMTLSNLTTTGTITTGGNINTTGQIITKGEASGLIFNDRSGNPAWQWYGTNGIANLWNGSRNVVAIDVNGNINSSDIKANNIDAKSYKLNGATINASFIKYGQEGDTVTYTCPSNTSMLGGNIVFGGINNTSTNIMIIPPGTTSTKVAIPDSGGNFGDPWVSNGKNYIATWYCG